MREDATYVKPSLIGPGFTQRLSTFVWKFHKTYISDQPVQNGRHFANDIFSNPSSSMTFIIFWLNIHRFFQRVQLTINQRWLRRCLGTEPATDHCMNQSDPNLLTALTHWGRDKMDAISRTIFSHAFSWMKMYKFQLRFPWSLFPNVQLTIFQHWFS